MKWILPILALAVFLSAFNEAHVFRRSSWPHSNEDVVANLRTLKQFLKNHRSHKQNQAARETVPLRNEELNHILDMIETHEISPTCFRTETCANDFMFNYNFVLGKLNERAAFLEFQFETNITEANEKQMLDFSPISNRFQSLTKNIAFKFLQNSQDWDAALKRMLFLAAQGIAIEDPEDVKTLSKLSSRLESIYATAKVCRNKTTTSSSSSSDSDDNSSSSGGSSSSSNESSDTVVEECLELEPGLTNIMQNSRNYAELVWAWQGWREASGKKMRSIFAQTVEIQNRAAQANNYTDLSEYWIDDFEDEEFEKHAARLFDRIKPLYRQVHAYVRNKLDAFYGSNYPSWHNPELIPAHLLGNMWAQAWDNIFDLVKPYPDAVETNLTEILLENNFTSIKMFKEAEKFFASIGLFEMTPEFWKHSMIEKPDDREVVCHASATDLYNGYDFRIKMCTSVNDDHFSTIHHEMGHIEYYMAYRNQPAIFKTGANSAFHEAIGDTIALSVQSAKHFKAINMIQDDKMTPEQEINYLMKMALKKIVFIPFGYLMDKWRWDVFRGRIDESNYNQKWWEMRKEYQGLEPPVERSEQDFDPGAKYHIASYTPYARYFISHFLQFQFYKSLCEHANHMGPLHTCDFYESKEAGSYLKRMLELGASKHWSYALKTLSNESKVSADAIIEYFKPLQTWLEKENLKHSRSKLVM